MSEDRQNTQRRYLALLDSVLKMLRLSGADDEVLKLHKNFMQLVRSTPLDNRERRPGKPSRTPQKAKIELPTEKDVATLGDLQVREILSDPNASRKLLELIAKTRYRIPVGELSRLTNKELLKERLLTLLNNKQTQLNLARFAARDSSSQ